MLNVDVKNHKLINPAYTEGKTFQTKTYAGLEGCVMSNKMPSDYNKQIYNINTSVMRNIRHRLSSSMSNNGTSEMYNKNILAIDKRRFLVVTYSFAVLLVSCSAISKYQLKSVITNLEVETNECYKQ